ncbi:MAG: hypothetical protein IJF49_08465 [Clostridia bacterium]|nr:hypothetical protein [Clostridia bacterium]
MANTINLAQAFLPLLDEVYKVSSRTAVLDAMANRLRFVNANTVQIFTTDMDGLADYSRTTGFVDGDVKGEWKPYVLAQDRGRSFTVDDMDDEETIRMAFGTVVSEFIRTRVVPEVDAYTFAKIAGADGILSANADITDSTDVAKLVDEADAALNDAEVPTEGRLLFMAEPAYTGLISGTTRTVLNGEGKVDNGITSYNGKTIIRVPQNRFNTAITMVADGAGGFTPTAGGYGINFLLMHPSAVAKVVKHVKPRIFSPDTNQKADAWKFDYRVYHDTFVMENKKKGIYLHRAAKANA